MIWKTLMETERLVMQHLTMTGREITNFIFTSWGKDRDAWLESATPEEIAAWVVRCNLARPNGN